MDLLPRNQTSFVKNNTLTSNPSSWVPTLQAALTVFVMTVVIVGNIIVLVVIFRQQTRPRVRVANMFIANLAVVDLSVGLFLFPFAVAKILSRPWTIGDALCQFNGAMNVIAGAASIITMAVISIDRYRAIVSPPGRKVKSRQAWVLLASLWAVSIVLGVLPVMGWNEYAQSPMHTMCKMSFTEDRGYILLVAVTCFLIPLIVMFYCYLRVFLKVRFHKKQVQRWNSSQETEINFRRETKTARVVFTVLFVFVGCWTPFVTVHILQASLSISLSRAVFHCVTLVAGLHSACNPIIYITMNRTFRNDFLHMCPCKRSGSVTNCGRQNRVHPLNTETSLTLRS